MALSINVGEQSTITAAQVAQEAGQTADLTLMRFNADQAVPGMTRAGVAGQWATELTGAPSTPGTYTLQADLVDGGTSYGSYTAPVTVTGTDPAPDPEPTPEQHPLAARLAAYLRLPGDPGMLQLANTHLPIVEAFVHGYTRGRGFGEDGRPEAPLEAVVVSATARLSANPEQVAAYTAGDYSEKSAVLAGWTLPEQAVLHRYRRRTNRAATAAEAAELNKLNAELLAPYALTADVVASLSAYATLADLPDLDPYALKSEIPAEPDLSGYALKSEIPAEPDLDPYVTETELGTALTTVMPRSTAPRQLKALLPALAEANDMQLFRIGNLCILAFANLKLSTGATGDLWKPTQGFSLPSSMQYSRPGMVVTTEGDVRLVSGTAARGLYLASFAPGASYHGTLTWVTRDGWPEILPGVAA